jgi:hypothetical protein
MYKAKIKLIYKQVIEASSKIGFERAIISASYQEFLLKSQAYNPDGKLKTFSRMKENDGRANSLHYKLSFPVLPFIDQLNHKIPVLTDTLGNKVSFENAAFELIESSTETIAQHKVALNYQTETLNLIQFMGEYMLLAKEGPEDNDAPAETFVIRMQQGLSIKNYQEVSQFAVSSFQ